jgi:hypothetical protein
MTTTTETQLRPERRQRERGPKPTTTELRACFHRLWTSQVGERGYNKHDWQELQRLIYHRFGVEL